MVNVFYEQQSNFYFLSLAAKLLAVLRINLWVPLSFFFFQVLKKKKYITNTKKAQSPLVRFCLIGSMSLKAYRDFEIAVSRYLHL